ncbi:hypothetical protein [Paenarthrobacter ureafaciens]|uniref:hypothetical protein n=1 Tax=Paenarthrobacter ureafaciens TaxID=37931 RepID=UPI001FB34486|nr:hypothetical protein [Paenarthrobacter ureafaciens]UOD80314.1 hypothetical protein MQZ73_14495 [Paenarthrobacter ureafaciens]WNZ04336.1 hypothetical protein PVT25_01895 [Paenarthrobacter ureafaciens]
MTDVAIPQQQAAGLAIAQAPIETQATLSLVGWASELDAAYKLASMVCQTAFVPQHFRNKPEETAVAMLYGHTLEMPPMVAVKSIYVVHGTPALYAQAMYAIALSKGHEIERVEATENRVVFRARRRGVQAWQKVEWTIARATQAGYTSNAKYRENPIGMLTEKCKAEAAKLVAPDALAGMSSVEEIQLGDFDVTDYSESAPVEATPAPKKRTVQRKQAPAPDLPEVVHDAPQDEVAEEAPVEELATKAQLTKIHVILGKLGASDREAGLAELSNHTGRTITSSKELTKAEASRFIEEAETPPADEDGVLTSDEAWLAGTGAN